MSGRVFANTTNTSASPPFVIHAFDPFSVQPPSVFSARVAKPNASDPEPGSESAYAPIVPDVMRGRMRARCSALP